MEITDLLTDMITKNEQPMSQAHWNTIWDIKFYGGDYFLTLNVLAQIFCIFNTDIFKTIYLNF